MNPPRTVSSGLAPTEPRVAQYPQLSTRFQCTRAYTHPPSRPGHPWTRTAHPRGRRTPPVCCWATHAVAVPMNYTSSRPGSLSLPTLAPPPRAHTHQHTLTHTSTLKHTPQHQSSLNHMILALLKSISGCAAINFLRISCSSTTQAHNSGSAQHSRSAEHSTAHSWPRPRTDCFSQ